MSYRKVSVIMGGTSSERQVSLASGEAVALVAQERAAHRRVAHALEREDHVARGEGAVAGGVGAAAAEDAGDP